jgi:hydrogenase maturation protease
MKDLRQHLAELLQGRVCLMGLGNVDCGDDGVGVRLAEELMEAGVPDVVVARTTPEDYVGRVADQGFDRLIFLDAVQFGAPPGSVVLLNAREICARYPQISTHKISLGVLAKWVRASSRTKVWLLGVQPQSVRPVQSLTPTVSATRDLLRMLVLELNDVRTAAFGCPAERSSAVIRQDEAVTA